MKILREIKKYSITAIIVSAIIGAIFIIFPNECIKYMSLAIGIGLILMGVGGVINYVVKRDSDFALALSIVSMITGIVVCVKYERIISIIIVLIGVFIMSTGLFNLITGVRVIVSKTVTGWITIVMSFAEIVFGIIAIFQSRQLTAGIVVFIGVSLILYSVLDILAFFQVKKLVNKLNDIVVNNSEIQTDATVIEEYYED